MAERLFRHVLVPADGSEAAIAAARLAFRIARSHQGHVELLYVLDTLLCEELRRFDKRELDEIKAELLEQGRRTLQTLADEAERMGLTAHHELRQGDPFEEIVSHAREHGSDLIVMGHVGRRPHKKVLLGSVAERVVEFAPCPVMVVKHDDEDRPSRRGRTPIGG